MAESYVQLKEKLHRKEWQASEPFVSSFTCISCKTNKIDPFQQDIIADQQEKALWNNGVVEKLTPGYGSKHDLTQYYGAICDECLTKLKDEGIIKDVKQIRIEYNKKLYE